MKHNTILSCPEKLLHLQYFLMPILMITSSSLAIILCKHSAIGIFQKRLKIPQLPHYTENSYTWPILMNNSQRNYSHLLSNNLYKHLNLSKIQRINLFDKVSICDNKPFNKLNIFYQY